MASLAESAFVNTHAVMLAVPIGIGVYRNYVLNLNMKSDKNG